MDGFARARHDVDMPDDADMPVGRGREGLSADDADDADFFEGSGASNGEVGGKMDGFARACHDVDMPDDADRPVGRGEIG